MYLMSFVIEAMRWDCKAILELRTSMNLASASEGLLTAAAEQVKRCCSDPQAGPETRSRLCLAAAVTPPGILTSTSTQTLLAGQSATQGTIKSRPGNCMKAAALLQPYERLLRCNDACHGRFSDGMGRQRSSAEEACQRAHWKCLDSAISARTFCSYATPAQQASWVAASRTAPLRYTVG